MVSRIFALILLLVILYIGSVFLFPNFADTYGSLSWNESIRNFKAKLDTDNAQFGSGQALIEKVTDIAKPYIDETKVVTEQVQTTIETKTQQVKQATESVQKAYDAVEGAKKDIQNVTNFGTGSR